MRDARLDILMITFNRPRYTALSLKQLLDTCEPGMQVWVWQNGGDRETLEVVSSFSGHPRLKRIHVSQENKRLREPTNWFWQHSTAPFVSKVDDDCLVPCGWAPTLLEVHDRSPNIGAIACWHFYEEDFVEELAARKIQALPGGHRIMRNCWVPGSGYVLKRDAVERLGPIRPSESFTDYVIRASFEGWVNGWYFPFIHQEHMDDPRSPYSQFQTEDDFARNRPLSAIRHDVRSLAEWRNRARWMARALQEASVDPRQYLGWRAKLRRGVARLKRAAGWREPWRRAS